jgi:hypothetical protein
MAVLLLALGIGAATAISLRTRFFAARYQPGTLTGSSASMDPDRVGQAPPFDSTSGRPI